MERNHLQTQILGHEETARLLRAAEWRAIAQADRETARVCGRMANAHEHRASVLRGTL